MTFTLWEAVALAALIAVSGALFTRDLSRKIRVIRKGHSDRPRTDQLGTRIARVIREVLFQTRVIGGRPIAGLLHAAVFGGFLFFAAETTDHFLKAFGIPFLHPILGPLVPAFKIVLGFWAVIVIVGITGLAFRRFVLVKISPDPKSYSSGVVALLIVVLMATFLVAQTELAPLVAKANWWVHALIILVFPSLILRSKHFHILMAPVAIFFRTHRLSELLLINLDIEELEDEEEITLGLENLGALSWKQRMDFLSCVECRRCTDHCPANLAGQDLDPRGFILDGRKAVTTLGDDEPVVGPVISETALGQCTSCGACENICPVGIEHLQVLTGAKRAQALATGTGMVATDMLQTIERTGNALGKPKSDRSKLIEELGIPYFDGENADYLLWMGCVWSYNPDARSALESFVEILKASGTRFGVLKNEVCSGHHSRRQGEEMQFQTLASENIESMREVGATKIISPCPHCLHTIGREYSDVDAEFQPEVVHHSQLLGELVGSGRLELDPARWDAKKSTYHDPCYLGRYEGEYDAPRQLMNRAGLELVEMERCGPRAVCCGGGSGGFVREQDVEVRVDQIRSGHVKDTGAEVLVTSCPECKMMLAAATKETQDIAEVVRHALVDKGE